MLFQEHWHKGVVGIVASRLIEHYYRPTIVLTRSGDYVAGWARSVTGFNVYEAVHACREHLLGYGGHFAAAGMTLEIDKVDAFQNKFEEVIAASIPDHCLTPELIIDSEISFKDITPGFLDIINQMEPFGPENLRPVFVARRVTDSGFSKKVKHEHLRFSLRQNGVVITGIGFGMANKYPLLSQYADIVFKIDENEWNGQKSLQMKVIDVRASEMI